MEKNPAFYWYSEPECLDFLGRRVSRAVGARHDRAAVVYAFGVRRRRRIARRKLRLR